MGKRKTDTDAIEVARAEGRRQGILEVAESYHRAIARFFRSAAANPAEMPGVREKNQEIAKRHDTYADEILAECWLQEDADTVVANGDGHA